MRNDFIETLSLLRDQKKYIELLQKLLLIKYLK